MCECAKWDLIFFLNKKSHLFVSLFLWGSTWVIRLGQTWLYRLSYLEASGDLTFYLFLMNNSYLLNFFILPKGFRTYFFPFAFIMDAFHDVSCWGRMNE